MALAVFLDSIGVGEWFVLLAVVLIVVGPRRLPSAARTLGQYYSKFRRAAENFKRQLMDMDAEFDRAAGETRQAFSGPESSASGSSAAEPTGGAAADSAESAPSGGGQRYGEPGGAD